MAEERAGAVKLTPQEIVRLQVWLDDYCEEYLELTDTVQAALDEARRDIEQGRYRTRQPAGVAPPWPVRFKSGRMFSAGLTTA